MVVALLSYIHTSWLPQVQWLVSCQQRKAASLQPKMWRKAQGQCGQTDGCRLTPRKKPQNKGAPRTKQRGDIPPPARPCEGQQSEGHKRQCPSRMPGRMTQRRQQQGSHHQQQRWQWRCKSGHCESKFGQVWASRHGQGRDQSQDEVTDGSKQMKGNGGDAITTKAMMPAQHW